jgi:hypothetical protein
VVVVERVAGRLVVVVDAARVLADVTDVDVVLRVVVVVVWRVLVDTVVVALRVAVVADVFAQHWQKLLGNTHVTTAE